ncbi:reverse transcriptase domain-containing protein [Tanacetum coccineum]
MMKFTVVRASSPYNIILRRTGLQELRAVSSTVHAMLKFPTPKGIATLCARTKHVYECRWSDKKITEQEATKEKSEEHKAPEGEEKSFDMAGIPKWLIRHTLNVNNFVPPVAQKRRVLGTEKSQVLTKEVEEWVKAGIVRTNLNAACPKYYYPLPEIDLKIEALIGHPFKFFLDAYKGYHQVQMYEEDEEKTALYTDQGIYCYVKMPFGLKNAGATYEWLVDSAFQVQLGRNLEAYIDDMVIKSKTEQDMIMDIAETFDNPRKINMKLNHMKCSFSVGEGKFLGYMVTSEGIRANPKKTKAIADMQSLKTLKEMQSLGGKLAALNRLLSRSA